MIQIQLNIFRQRNYQKKILIIYIGPKLYVEFTYGFKFLLLFPFSESGNSVSMIRMDQKYEQFSLFVLI